MAQSTDVPVVPSTRQERIVILDQFGSMRLRLGRGPFRVDRFTLAMCRSLPVFPL
jgi:hypothetical protein